MPKINTGQRAFTLCIRNSLTVYSSTSDIHTNDKMLGNTQHITKQKLVTDELDAQPLHRQFIVPVK